ncbi:MAG: single-stranded-DNA-specific exonuclease RecJ [Candidatus Shapirobacteria bacterium]|nr:single-stranded-DNA-specific exonuclease RecJ [Candidatus Shapirobacteria bacterium]
MKWHILAKIKEQKTKFKNEEIIKILLKNRGLKTPKEIDNFLNPKKPEELSLKEVGLDPSEMKKAIKRIQKAIEKKEKIIVYGDYDADGLSGTAILWEALHNLKAQVLPFIPRREDGYGLKIEKIKELAREGVGLIITVDQGIVANQQVREANKLGIDVIITDHHILSDKKPKALAIIHTTQLAGCGVAWFLAQELFFIFKGEKNEKGLDLVTIGTIADMVPLLGPNRCLMKYGLKLLQKTKRPGLLALYDFASLKKETIDTFEVSYIIGPRLNAVGRMDDPMEALRLLCTFNEDQAINLAQKINQKNEERKSLMGKMTIYARNLWLKQDQEKSLIFIDHNSFHEGVIGLVAGKLMEEFYRPAVIISRGEKFSKGSARSINEFNIIEAVRSCAEILGPHGGHPKAAGFTIETEKITLFKEKLMLLAEEKLKGQKLSPTLRVDLELGLENLTFDFYKDLAKFEPFGEGNPQPVFLTKDVKMADARIVGKEKQHLSLKLRSLSGKIIFEGIGFNLGKFYSDLNPDKKIDLVYQLFLDEWHNEKHLKLKIKDLKTF